MQTKSRPAERGHWTRLVWLTPSIMSLFGCGGGGGSDAPPDATPAATPVTSTPVDIRGRWETILTYVPAF